MNSCLGGHSSGASLSPRSLPMLQRSLGKCTPPGPHPHPGDPRCCSASLPAHHLFPSPASQRCRPGTLLRAPREQSQLLQPPHAEGRPRALASPGGHPLSCPPPSKAGRASLLCAGGGRVPPGGCPAGPRPRGWVHGERPRGSGREATRNSRLMSI